MIRNYKNKLYVHRDIKSENILVHKDCNNKVVFKLADFGFSRTVNQDTQVMTSVLGTPMYMSPQLHNRESYTVKTDIFSLGVLFFQIFYGQNPWDFKHGPNDDR